MFTLLFALSTISTLGLSFLAMRHREPSGLTHALWTWGFGLILACWIRTDAPAYGYLRSFDFDSFVFFGWPLVVPYYLYRTRHARGIIPGFGIYALYFVPELAASIIRVVLQVTS
jgi:hypothetical protein